MKTIGLIGGMSWESTSTYYRMINTGIKERLGGLHSAKIVLVSVDFAEVEQYQNREDWSAASRLLADSASQLERAGVDAILICTNTMHKVASGVQSAVNIPLLHIADSTANLLIQDGMQKVGLLGTEFTMEQDFYVGRLEQLGLEVIVPEKSDRKLIHRVIYDELCLGEIVTSTRQQFVEICGSLAARGAEAIILGCTEIGLLLESQDLPTPLYDTTAIHAAYAVDFMLAD